MLAFSFFLLNTDSKSCSLNPNQLGIERVLRMRLLVPKTFPGALDGQEVVIKHSSLIISAKLGGHGLGGSLPFSPLGFPAPPH